MRVYLTIDPGTGRRIWRRNVEQAEDEQRRLGLKVSGYTETRIPDDKDGFLGWLNDNAAGPAQPPKLAAPAADAPGGLLVVDNASGPLRAAAEAVGDLADRVAAAGTVDTANASAVVDAIAASSGHTFGRYLVAAVRRLGSLGLPGRDAVNGMRDMGKLGSTFSRGTHLVGALALAEIAAQRDGERAVG